MKQLLSVVLVILFSHTGFTQFKDTYQPAEIYKRNNVRARVMMFDYNPYNSKVIDYFDHNGNVIEHLQYDTSGKHPYTRSYMGYDSAGKLTSEMILYYLYRFDTTTQGLVPRLTSVADTLTASITYDASNRITKKTFTRHKGLLALETTFSYDPLIQNDTWYIGDSISNKTVCHYDVPYIENERLSTGFPNQLNVHSEHFYYKNAYDKYGRIKRRSIKMNTEPVEVDPHMVFYFKDEAYDYMSNGLMMKKTSTNPIDGSPRMSAFIFDYKFW